MIVDVGLAAPVPSCEQDVAMAAAVSHILEGAEQVRHPAEMAGQDQETKSPSMVGVSDLVLSPSQSTGATAWAVNESRLAAQVGDGSDRNG